jgi:hypothetical protein
MFFICFLLLFFLSENNFSHLVRSAKVFFLPKNRFPDFGKSFFAPKIVSHAWGSHFSPQKSFPGLGEVIFRSKNRFPRLGLC